MRSTPWLLGTLALLLSISARGQAPGYDGLNNTLGNISRLSSAKSFAITPENPTGEKGKGGMSKEGTAANAARELGQGWKQNPFIVVQPGQVFTLADIPGSGAIQSGPRSAHRWNRGTGA